MMMLVAVIIFNVNMVSAVSLTSEELKLYSAHPIKAAKAKECADKAVESTNDKYKKCVRWQGNGDAYRHAYWSALMTRNIDKDFAWRVGLAHENLSTTYDFDKQDDDTKMDIKNNYAGRQLASSQSSKGLAWVVTNACSLGRLRRIRVYSSKKTSNSQKIDGVWMKFVGYYVATSDGGLIK